MVTMNRVSGAAAKMPEGERRDMAVRALAGSESITALADEHGVSRNFVYEQSTRASTALAGVFSTAANDDEKVLFECAVTPRRLEQMILALVLVGRASQRGVMEFLRDVMGWSISIGGVHDLLKAAAVRARVINESVDLSGVRVGLHDEIFQGNRPVLAGVDAASTYCYLLAEEAHRDGDTWAVHLLDAKLRGLNPDFTIADQGQGARIGQLVAWGETPCHSDVFHIQHQFEGVANTLARVAQGSTTRCQKLQVRLDKGATPDSVRREELEVALRADARMQALARDVRTLCNWLGRDVLALAGPALATRQELFDFVVAEMRRRESEDAPWIRPMRVALENQRDALLAFARVLDDKLSAIAQTQDVDEGLVRQVCLLERKPRTSAAYWQGWNRVRSLLTDKFHLVFDGVTRAMASTPRCSSLVENFNSRLRTYFTLRRHLGDSYLSLLQFFLNHRRFMRSRVGRQDHSPRELMTGQAHPHWFTLLGLGEPAPLRG